LNTKDYISLLNRPYSINERQAQELENILMDFPYLQSARALLLKGLYNMDSFRYNTELKKTAAHTTDRSILFEFITSEQFQSIQKNYLEESEKAISELTVKDSEIVAPPKNKLEESIKLTIKEATQYIGQKPAEAATVIEAEQQMPAEVTTPAEPKEEVIKQAEEKLEIGKPLEFAKSEKHSFQEWLQLSKLTPVKREEEQKAEKEPEPEIDGTRLKKLELIDRFIETNPKIVPDKNNPPSPANIERGTQDTSSFMTETLARVYLEQKKYTKAIQAYEILILKYPEKSVFFADRISEIKTLQQNNN
jgi:tetratricopeptide (TPR) repeat protein